MRKKNNKSRLMKRVQVVKKFDPVDPSARPDDDYENDSRPESSPYTEICSYLSVGPNRIRYTVPTHYLIKSPHFSRRLPLPVYPGDQTIEEPELDEDIGHTLVHFLYTDEYQTLKHRASSNADNEATEYKRSVLVYQAASTYGLPLLVEHAKENIGNFDNAVSVFEALDIAKAVYGKLQDGDEVWFYNYLKRKLKDAFDTDETVFAQDQFMGFIGESPTFSQMLVKLLEEIYNDALSRARIENGQDEAYETEKPDNHDGLANGRLELEYTESVPEPVPEELPEPVPDELPEPVPDELPEPVPEELPEPVPDELPEPVSEELPETMPEWVSSAPDEHPELMPELEPPPPAPEEGPELMPDLEPPDPEPADEPFPAYEKDNRALVSMKEKKKRRKKRVSSSFQSAATPAFPVE